MALVNLINTPEHSLAIVQGGAYNQLILDIEGDYSEAEFRAEIRKDTLENKGELLAAFSFNIEYIPEENITRVVPILTGAQTSAIPSTKFQGQGTINSKNGWVWDMEAHFPNQPDRPEKIITLSFVQVIAEVTNGD